jgi:hypothetical protein
MPNSNTKHSKKLRSKTATEYSKKNYKKFLIVFKINDHKDQKILQAIKKEGISATQFFRKIFDFYEKNS